MFKIMFVCHGNICRSPMAEFVFKDLLEKRGLTEKYYVSSSATSTEEIWNGIGNPVYPPAKAELKKHGISCDGKRAVQVTRSDYMNYDLLVVMDSNNMRNIMRIIGSDPDKKVHKLLTFANINRDVSDPWYSGDFTTCYNDILLGCTALLDTLEKIK
ncbi:MAG: low molecular weight phosphotyrosine protein phosphatase [Clostridia bacterium]|nr:low molecular weight phosphotyrosine protein phosphatase [Clostridia bacterium]